ncbi:MAG: hypothetical protein RIQ47_1448 [Bacteroidota bacterium]|jgi:carboxyl-terminal processing protease
MRDFLRRFRLYLAFAATLLVCFISFSFVDEYFEVSKQLDIFSTLYREVNLHYVDRTDPGKLMKTGIDAMLETLDPYTTYIPESDIEDYRFMTTGQYGGIGALVRQKGDYVVISEPYEGFPAQLNDLRAGDELVEIDGKSLKGKKTDEVSRLLKGSPGTSFKLIIRREGQSGTLEKNITRSEIKVKCVPYYAMLNDSIGYVKLTGFTDKSTIETAAAIRALKEKGELKGLILDLRGNPGGLLQEAVNISNLFLPRGEDIVSTKGRMQDMDKNYKAVAPPLDDQIPLAVLVNSGSASASEIVSGSLQDLDRAVIIGQRTYGKGLVQSTRPLSYNSQLKVTTAKYYIPSGRCIQAVDYSNRNSDGSVGKVPDSLMHEFKTKGGRTVRDGGGILPDIKTEPRKYSNITTSLITKNIVFDFATRYRTLHDSVTLPVNFSLNENDWKEFMDFLKNKEYEYSTKSERSLEEMKKNAEEENYFGTIEKEYIALKEKLVSDKQSDLLKHKEEILQVLEEEIITRYYFQTGRTAASIDHDEDVSTARELLKQPDRYRSILNGISAVKK